MTDGFRLSEQAVQRTAATVRRVLGEGVDTSSGRRTIVPGSHTELEGILDEDLDPATDPISGKSEAEMRLILADDSEDGAVLSEETITVTNRNTGFSAQSGDYLRVTFINGEFRPVAGGTTIRRALTLTPTTKGGACQISVLGGKQFDELTPIEDGPIGSWNFVGGTGGIFGAVDTPHANVNSTPPASSYAYSQSLSDTLWLKLSSPETDFEASTAIAIFLQSLRMEDLRLRTVRLFKTDRTTPLSAEIRVFQRASWTLQYLLSNSISGRNSPADWESPYLRLVTDTSSSASDGEVRVSAAGVLLYSRGDDSPPLAYSPLADVNAGVTVHVAKVAGSVYPYEIISAEPLLA